MIDELSDIDDLSGLSSSTSEDSLESPSEGQVTKKKKTDSESKGKRRRRKKTQESDEDDDDSNDDSEDKTMDPTEMRNKIVRHLEEMRLANQKRKRSNENIPCNFLVEFLLF